MARAGSVVDHLRRALARGPAAAVGDAELLDRFAGAGDQAAFELLVWRHERMVLGVCRRVLRNHHAAEDAFQATFLVLARKAGSIRKTASLAGWLHRVASRVAHHARERASRQPRPARPATDLDSLPSAREPGPDPLAGDLGAVLDEEVGRLPEKCRAAVVLCYLEGKTYAEAARELGCPKGTVSGHLTRARHLLQARLTRRGVTLGGGLLAGALCGHAAAAAAPAELVAATLNGVLSAASGRAAGAVSAEVASLVEGVLRAMTVQKLRVLSVLFAAVAAAGVFAAALYAGEPGQPPAEKAQGDARPAAAGKPRIVDAGGAVDAVSWSPDGKLLATHVRTWSPVPGGDSRITGKALQIRDAETGAVRRTLYDEDDLIDGQFSPDGKSVAAPIAGENVVRLWDPATGKAARTFKGDKVDDLTKIAFSRDGRLLAAAGEDGNPAAEEGTGVAVLWEVGSGKLLHQVRAHQDGISALAFAPDGKTLATGSPDRTIKFWDTATGECKQTLRGEAGQPRGVPYSLAFSPDGKLLASGGLDGAVRVWDAGSGELKYLKSGYVMGLILLVEFSPDGRWLAVAGTALGGEEEERGDVRLFDAKTGKLGRAFPDQLGPGVRSLAVSPDGEALAMGNWNKQLFLLPLPK